MPSIQSNQLRTIRNWTKDLPNKIRIFYSRYEYSAWYCSQSWLLGCCLHDGIRNWKHVRGTRWFFLPWCGRGVIWRSWTEVILFYIYIIWYLFDNWYLFAPEVVRVILVRTLSAYRYQIRYQIFSLICWASFQPYPFAQLFVPCPDCCASSVHLFDVLELFGLIVALHILCVSHKLVVWDPRACDKNGCWVPRGESPFVWAL